MEQPEFQTLTASEIGLEADLGVLERYKEIQASVAPYAPAVPYNREMAQILIQCSRLATEQYLRGEAEPDYNGSIQPLISYSDGLNPFTQKASLVLQQSAAALSFTRSKESSRAYFFGFALTSPKVNLLIYRGTQERSEWVLNMVTVQQAYLESEPKYGKIHSGFARIYGPLAEQSRQIIESFDPALPCYIAGHSLGAALAPLAAMDISLNTSYPRENLHVYAFGGPRIGDPAFANAYHQQIPNSYRVANMADVLTILPPTQFRGAEFLPVGQEWRFATQLGDTLPNHVVETYREAIENQREVQV